jgi:hypothetical protein
MRKFLFALVLSLPAAVFAQIPAAPADYPITIHVMYSRYQLNPGQYQLLEVVINGQRMELKSEGASGVGVLALGDYPAQTHKYKFAPSKPNGYDTFVTYRFLLPDGKIRDFDVVGLGPKADFTSPPPSANP